MAIRPTQGTPVTIPPDDSTSRWGEWVAGLDTAGDTAGGVVGEIDSKAESANTGTGTLAADLTELEGRVETLEGATFPDLSGYPTQDYTDDQDRKGRGAIATASIPAGFVGYATITCTHPSFTISGQYLRPPTGTFLVRVEAVNAGLSSIRHTTGGSETLIPVDEGELTKILPFAPTAGIRLYVNNVSGAAQTVRIALISLI